MNEAVVQSRIASAIEARGYKVHFDMPGEGFTLEDRAGEFVEQNGAADESVNQLAILLEILTTDQGFDCDGTPAVVASRMLLHGDPVASLQQSWDDDLAQLTAILANESHG